MQEFAWYSLLPQDLLHNAYRTGNELAWPREQALRVLDLLDANGYEVFGVDTWFPTKPGPTPIIYDWSPENAQHNSVFPPTAREFIRKLTEIPYTPNPKNLEFVFNIWAKKK